MERIRGKEGAVSIRRATVVLACVVSTTASSCGGCVAPSSDASVDTVALFDANRLDDGPVMPDSGNDDSDASAVCSVESDSPERWQRFPFFCRCDARLANEPARAFSFEWTDCDAPTGCRQLVLPRPTGRDLFFAGVQTPTGVVAVVRRIDAPSNRTRLYVGPLEGSASLAIEGWAPGNTPGHCQLGTVALSPNTVGVELFRSTDTVGNEMETFLVAGPWAVGQPWREPAADLTAPAYRRVIFPYFTLAEREFATVLGSSVLRSSLATQVLNSVADSTSVGGEVCCAQAIDNDTWFMAGGRTQSVWLAQLGLPPQRVYDPISPANLMLHVTQRSVVVAENSNMDGPAEQQIFRLRAALRTTRPADFVFRTVWTLPAGVRPKFIETPERGDWVALELRTPNVPGAQVAVLDLRDGSHYLWPPAPPFEVERVSFLSDTEIGVVVIRDGDYTVRRFPLTSLGPLRPPS